MSMIFKLKNSIFNSSLSFSNTIINRKNIFIMIDYNNLLIIIMTHFAIMLVGFWF